MYRVTKQFARGVETTLQTFPRREAAEAFIQDKLIEDARMKVQTIYRVYDDLDEMMREFNTADISANSGATAYQVSGQSTGRAQSFNPTPFNTTPQPTSIPRSWVKDVESEK